MNAIFEIKGRQFNFSLRRLKKTQGIAAKLKMDQNDVEDFICMHAGGFATMEDYDAFCEELTNEEYEQIVSAYGEANMGFMDMQARAYGVEEMPSQELKKQLHKQFQKASNNKS